MQGFVNPTLALGALLALVPLIIHLLNRRRHRPMAWGAMRFVEAAFKRTRRRMRMENLLLLLLRMAAVAALALAIARPFAGRGALGSLTEASRDLVLLLDGSASTGYRADIETTFDRIVRRAEAIVDRLDEGRG
ncbi:MAG: BatA domain-containing protein, partial [Planctomycetes bacterium]|nr:BatA domain-containing protein [Planctomycetota bacterium]